MSIIFKKYKACVIFTVLIMFLFFCTKLFEGNTHKEDETDLITEKAALDASGEAANTALETATKFRDDARLEERTASEALELAKLGEGELITKWTNEKIDEILEHNIGDPGTSVGETRLRIDPADCPTCFIGFREGYAPATSAQLAHSLALKVRSDKNERRMINDNRLMAAENVRTNNRVKRKGAATLAANGAASGF